MVWIHLTLKSSPVNILRQAYQELSPIVNIIIDLGGEEILGWDHNIPPSIIGITYNFGTVNSWLYNYDKANLFCIIMIHSVDGKPRTTLGWITFIYGSQKKSEWNSFDLFNGMKNLW